MNGRLWARPIMFGVSAAIVLLTLYFIVLALVSGWAFTFQQFADFWYFVVALALGFGLQVALFVRLRHVARHDGRAGGAVAVSGGTSTAAMISCCAHYLVNVMPVLGATGLVALIAQYQTELFWVGLAFNLAGVAYIGRKLLLATRHMAWMEAQA